MALLGYDLQRHSEHAQHRLGRQFETLTKEVGRIAARLRRFGTGASVELGQVAHEVADEAMQQGAEVAKLMGKQALQAGKAIRRDPVPALVAVAGLACLLRLVMSSSRRRPTIH